MLLVLHGQVAVAPGEQETAARIAQQLRSLPPATQTQDLALPAARLMTEFRLAQRDLAAALAAARTVLARLPDAEPRYLWPLLTTAMRACAEAGPAGL